LVHHSTGKTYLLVQLQGSLTNRLAAFFQRQSPCCASQVILCASLLQTCYHSKSLRRVNQ
jgi:hypothetical protein